MPRGDRTGPVGLGPLTGRAAGYCAGYQVPGYANPCFGRAWFGHGYGRRGGRFGHRRGFRGYFDYSMQYEARLTPKEELVILKRQQEEIKKRIDALEKAQEQEKEEI